MEEDENELYGMNNNNNPISIEKVDRMEVNTAAGSFSVVMPCL